MEKQNRRKRIKKRKVTGEEKRKERRKERREERRKWRSVSYNPVSNRSGEAESKMNHVESERVTGFNGKTRAIVFSLKVI